MESKRRLSNERGAAMVEMIMVLPVLLFILFAIVELSRAWFTVHLTTTAVREGARAAAVATAANASSQGGNRLTEVLAAAGITATSSTVVLQDLAGCGVPCDKEVIATANVTFQTLFPVLIPQLQTINVTQVARMRFEGG